jgi:phage terminase large subunit GpA-like protein
MVELGTGAAPPPARFATVADAILEALPSLAPRSRVTVGETAPRRMIESGGQWVPWRRDVAPYMAEPMDLITSRRFDSVAFVGPARSSKSEGLVINPLAHAIMAQPRVVAVFSPDKGAAQEWSIGALDPLIENSPELASRLASGKGADNIFTKRFRGGCRVTVDWPVKTKLAQRSIALVIGTDYDAFPEDIGGDGSAFGLMRKRTEAAGSRGMTVVESSPRFPILDESWTPSTAHEAPPAEGIAGIYNRGSRGRLYWTCGDCGELFEPRFDRLSYADEGSPEVRGASACMVCPNCGSVIEARRKAELNRGAAWLHEDDDGSLSPIGDLGRVVATASYWLPGPAAALASWSRIVSRYLEAVETFEATGGEGDLKAVVNAELGLSYLPRSRAASAGLSETALREAATDDAWQVAPAGTAFLTIAVDVQIGRFVVQVEAWRPRLERVVVDRFDLFTPPDGAPNAGGRRIEPGKFAEDWQAVLELADKVYPVAGSDGLAMKPLAIIVDAAGEPGVTPNAYAFWRRAKLSHPRRFYLVRGRGGEIAKRAELRFPESAHRGKEYAARDVPIVRAGTDRLKDEIAASLLREVGGPRRLGVSRFAPAEVFAEYAAERRGAKGWEKRPGVQRNEALDLSVYALALVIVLEAEAINWDRPPRWALPGPRNAMTVDLGGEAPTDAPAEVEAPAAEPARRGWAIKRPGKGRR